MQNSTVRGECKFTLHFLDSSFPDLCFCMDLWLYFSTVGECKLNLHFLVSSSSDLYFAWICGYSISQQLVSASSRTFLNALQNICWALAKIYFRNIGEASFHHVPVGRKKQIIFRVETHSTAMYVQDHLALCCVYSVADLHFSFISAAGLSTVGCECKFILHFAKSLFTDLFSPILSTKCHQVAVSASSPCTGLVFSCWHALFFNISWLILPQGLVSACSSCTGLAFLFSDLLFATCTSLIRSSDILFLHETVVIWTLINLHYLDFVPLTCVLAFIRLGRTLLQCCNVSIHCTIRLQVWHIWSPISA